MIDKMTWIGPLEEYETIVTENPIEEIWHQIDFFTAEETIAKCNPPVDKELIPFICESIAQAEEFRSSASVSGEHTKPLLAYYSVHNLTKAMLALETNQRPQGYHGLMKVALPADEDFLGISAQINMGVFSELLSFNKIKPEIKLKFTIDDLIKQCGYLRREYSLAYDKRSTVITPHLKADIRLNELELRFDKADIANEQNLPLLFPKLMEYFKLTRTENNRLILGLKDDVVKGDLHNIQSVIRETLVLSVFNYSPLFLVPCNAPILNWPQEAYLYALSFILGSLVRYYPDYWYKNIIAHKKNRWVVRKINSVVERVYPNLMFNIMYGKKMYRFSPGGY